jgi:uncharacterized protein YfdQ (DUF2303 family)
MSMSVEAVKHIQETANIPAIADQLVNAETQVPVALVPSSMEVESLERYMPNASRMRMSYRTTSIEDFIKYSSDNELPCSTCFVDAEEMNAETIIDLGSESSPGHKDHKAKLNLKKTAAFKAILNINGVKQAQKSAAEFLEDWAGDGLAVLNSAGDVMNLQASVKALLDMTIESAREVNSKVGDFGESMSAMERIEAKNQESLPSEIIFSCSPYNGLDIRDFKLRVGVLTGGDKPSVVYRIVALELQEEDIAEEFKGKLNAAFETTGISTYIGTA